MHHDLPLSVGAHTPQLESNAGNSLVLNADYLVVAEVAIRPALKTRFTDADTCPRGDDTVVEDIFK